MTPNSDYNREMVINIVKCMKNTELIIVPSKDLLQTQIKKKKN